MRAKVVRKTKETDISVELNTTGEISISTGIGFFDHMLEAFAFHGGFGLMVKAEGDLRVDGHHTVEDVGIVLGKAFGEALGRRAGLERFGSAYVPMDEALGFAAVDIGGRAFLAYDAPGLESAVIGGYDACLTKEFFRALSSSAAFTLHLRASGENAHHIAESLFKAAGRALRQALEAGRAGIASTKGVLV